QPPVDLGRGLAELARNLGDVASMPSEQRGEARALAALLLAELWLRNARRGYGPELEMPKVDHAFFAQPDRRRQAFVELAHVVREGMREEGARGAFGEGDPLGLGCMAAQNGGDQRAQVLAALAQRRQRDDEPGEPRVQIRAERACRHAGTE